MLKTPMKRMRKSYCTMIYYLILWIFFQALLFIFIYPTIELSKNLQIIWVYVISFFSLCSFVFAILSSCRNPGFLT